MRETISDTGLSRRGFIGAAAGLTFTLALPQFARAADAPQAAGDAKAIGAWAKIGTDGSIAICAPAAEMGQGSFTGLAMIFAEELDADWAHVTAVIPPPNAAIFGNPAFGGALITVGSESVRGYWDKIRPQAAAIRRVLMQAAADKWGVPLGEVHTEPSLVVHTGSGKKLSYAEIAAFAKVPDPMPTVDPSEFKKTADYRILGKTAPRFDIPDKITGAAKFAIDVQVPNMVYATLLRCPVDNAVPDQVDGAAAQAMPGVLKVMPLKDAVAVVGDSVEGVFAARDKLKVTWKPLPADNYQSAQGVKDFLARAAKLDDKGKSFVSTGDVDGAFGKAAKVVKAQYTSDYVYHAQMEPLNVIASVNPAGDGAEIWIGTQSATATIMTAAGVLKTKPENIKLNQLYLGGGYGRRSPADWVPDALVLSKAMQRPVKLIWTREQDVKSAKMRPMTGHQIEAALDGDGNVTGWRHRIVGESVVAYRGGEKALQGAKGLDIIVLEGSKHEYAVPNQSIAFLREDRGVGLSAWRGIGAGYNKFVIESFIDELAAERKIDPVAFRLGLLKDDPRAMAVVKAVAAKSGWGNKPADGHVLGFAYGKVVDSYVAAVGDISLDESTGVIRAHKFWVAIDPGVVINPDSVLAQSEGNVVFGLSQTFKETVSIVDGQVQQNNFYDYPVLRMSEVPEIDIQIIPTDNRPSGMGEAVLPLMAPCVGNAVFRLTGKRFRNLPLSPERVKAGLAAT